MGLHKCWQITWAIVYLILLCLIEGSTAYDLESLDAFVRDCANEEITNPHTGIFYNISLPANFSGMEVSAVRIRRASFWLRGVNYSFFYLPPRIIPEPDVKRMVIVYENLGNWSSHYYNVPNYTMVAPVVGFMPYVSSDSRFISSEKINFRILNYPITIQFPHVGTEGRNKTPICAKFAANGSVELSNMTKPYVCQTHSQGRYTLVIPSPMVPEAQTPSQSPRSKGHGKTKWRILGFVVSSVVLVLLALVLVAIVKLEKRRRFRKMVRSSERGVPLDTFWLEDAKMPSASMIRTQPVIETDYNPH